MSSLHLVFGRPVFLLPVRGLHTVVSFVQRLSVSRTTCPAHCHFSLAIFAAISITPVLAVIHELLFLSLSVTPIIDLSIDRCVLLSFVIAVSVKLHVSDPYVKTGRTHSLNTLVFKFCGRSLLNMYLSFPYAA